MDKPFSRAGVGVFLESPMLDEEMKKMFGNSIGQKYLFELSVHLSNTMACTKWYKYRLAG